MKRDRNFLFLNSCIKISKGLENKDQVYKKIILERN